MSPLTDSLATERGFPGELSLSSAQLRFAAPGAFRFDHSKGQVHGTTPEFCTKFFPASDGGTARSVTSSLRKPLMKT